MPQWSMNRRLTTRHMLFVSDDRLFNFYVIKSYSSCNFWINVENENLVVASKIWKKSRLHWKKYFPINFFINFPSSPMKTFSITDFIELSQEKIVVIITIVDTEYFVYIHSNLWDQHQFSDFIIFRKCWDCRK